MAHKKMPELFKKCRKKERKEAWGSDVQMSGLWT